MTTTESQESDRAHQARVALIVLGKIEPAQATADELIAALPDAAKRIRDGIVAELRRRPGQFSATKFLRRGFIWDDKLRVPALELAALCSDFTSELALREIEASGYGKISGEIFSALHAKIDGTLEAALRVYRALYFFASDKQELDPVFSAYLAQFENPMLIGLALALDLHGSGEFGLRTIAEILARKEDAITLLIKLSDLVRNKAIQFRIGQLLRPMLTKRDPIVMLVDLHTTRSSSVAGMIVECIADAPKVNITMVRDLARLRPARDNEENETFQRTALEALGKRFKQEEAMTLLECLQTEDDPKVRLIIAKALKEAKDRTAAILLEALTLPERSEEERDQLIAGLPGSKGVKLEDLTRFLKAHPGARYNSTQLAIWKAIRPQLRDCPPALLEKVWFTGAEEDQLAVIAVLGEWKGMADTFFQMLTTSHFDKVRAAARGELQKLRQLEKIAGV